MAGRFIVLEGIDGSGTTTQAARVANALRERGLAVTETHEPGSGPIGIEIRKLLRPEATPPTGLMPLLFAADRLEHVQNVIMPALARGEVVICDRYELSSLVYQGLDHPAHWIREINTFAVRPWLTFLLDLPAELAGERLRSRGGVVERYDALDQQEALRLGYLSHARDRWQDGTPMIDFVVDASRSIDAVTQAIVGHIVSRGI